MVLGAYHQTKKAGSEGRAFITQTQLETIVVESEAMLNNRPLTYVSSDLSDPEPLTPADMLGYSQFHIIWRILNILVIQHLPPVRTSGRVYTNRNT